MHTNIKWTSKLYYRFEAVPSTWSRLGLDFWDLPDAAWEFTKLSFVWDWFIGIGDWLRSLQMHRDRTVLGQYVTVKRDVKYSAWYEPGSLTVGGIYKVPFDQYEGCELVYRKTCMQRRVVSPDLSILPVWNPSSLGIERTLDGLSLIWQRLPNLKGR
jgi:hypothetical protein